jgi:hypothetical protein
MCAHTLKICKLIQTSDGHRREDMCKECGAALTCKHFELPKTSEPYGRGRFAASYGSGFAEDLFDDTEVLDDY